MTWKESFIEVIKDLGPILGIAFLIIAMTGVLSVVALLCGAGIHFVVFLHFPPILSAIIAVTWMIIVLISFFTIANKLFQVKY